jgi:hypothetical protein
VAGYRYRAASSRNKAADKAPSGRRTARVPATRSCAAPGRVLPLSDTYRLSLAETSGEVIWR